MEVFGFGKPAQSTPTSLDVDQAYLLPLLTVMGGERKSGFRTKLFHSSYQESRDMFALFQHLDLWLFLTE